jgi:hypothetical protein
VTVTGDARQVDAAESPIPRTLPTSRLFMVQRGQHIEVAVQTLGSLDVLAAVVRDHERTVVLTRRGDLVSDETLRYENNGIDYLLMNADGRPIYLATDGKSERILHREKGADEMMIPLRTGSHAVRVQSLAQAGVAFFFGRAEVPLSTYPLTASRVGVRLGLPAFVYPIAFLGGDHAQMFADEGDFLALTLAAVFAVVILRGWLRRALGAIVLGGLWFVSEPLFVAVMGLLALSGVVWLAGRFLSGKTFVFVTVLLVGGGAFFLLIGFLAIGLRSNQFAPMASESAPLTAGASVPEEQARDDALGGSKKLAPATSPRRMRLAACSKVTPVALTLPAFERRLMRAAAVTRSSVSSRTPYARLAMLPAGTLALLAALSRLHAQLRRPLTRARARSCAAQRVGRYHGAVGRGGSRNPARARHLVARRSFERSLSSNPDGARNGPPVFGADAGIERVQHGERAFSGHERAALRARLIPHDDLLKS